MENERATLGCCHSGVSECDPYGARVHVTDDPTPTTRGVPPRQRRKTAEIARRSAASGVRRFVFVSSVKVHGEQRDKPFTEDDAPAPEDAYARSKWEAEQALRAIEQETGMEVAIVRPPLVYGPGVRANFLKLMEAVHKRTPLPFGLVRNRRSLIFVANLADALAACLTHPAAAGRTFLSSDGDDRYNSRLDQSTRRSDARSCHSFAVAWVTARGGRRLGKEAEISRLIGFTERRQRGLFTTSRWHGHIRFTRVSPQPADYWRHMRARGSPGMSSPCIWRERYGTFLTAGCAPAVCSTLPSASRPQHSHAERRWAGLRPREFTRSADASRTGGELWIVLIMSLLAGVGLVDDAQSRCAANSLRHSILTIGGGLVAVGLVPSAILGLDLLLLLGGVWGFNLFNCMDGIDGHCGHAGDLHAPRRSPACGVGAATSHGVG